LSKKNSIKYYKILLKEKQSKGKKSKI